MGIGLKEFLIAPKTGWDISNTPISKLYANDGLGNFTEVTGMPFVGAWGGSIAFADVDGDEDEDQDALITGKDGLGFRNTKLYNNDAEMVPTVEREGYKKDRIALLYPNPATTEEIFLEYTSEKRNSLEISFFDLTGRMIFLQNSSILPGTNTILINHTELKKGIYFIRLDDGYSMSTLKLIVQ